MPSASDCFLCGADPCQYKCGGRAHPTYASYLRRRAHCGRDVWLRGVSDSSTCFDCAKCRSV